MSFLDIVTSLTIGIVSGAFSSVFVSRVSILVSYYREQLHDLRQRLLPLYGVKILLLQNVNGQQKKLDAGLNQMLSKGFLDAQINFSDNMPEDYRYDFSNLYCIALNLLESYHDIAQIDDEQEIRDICDEIDSILSLLENCQKNYVSNCYRWCIKDCVLRVLAAIFVLTLILLFITLAASC